MVLGQEPVLYVQFNLKYGKLLGLCCLALKHIIEWSFTGLSVMQHA